MSNKNNNVDYEYKFNIDISKEQWMQTLRDNEIIKEEDLNLLKLIYASEGHMATASQLAQLLDLNHFVLLNSQVGRMAKRIIKALDIEANKREDGSYRWWNVPFWGTQTKEGFYWILRPELKEAIDELINKCEVTVIEGRQKASKPYMKSDI